MTSRARQSKSTETISAISATQSQNSLRGPIFIDLLHSIPRQRVHVVVGAQSLQDDVALPVHDVNIAHVPFDRMLLLLEDHGKAPVSLLQGLAQLERVVVAAVGAPDRFALEFERALVEVAFRGVVLMLGPDFHFHYVGF